MECAVAERQAIYDKKYDSIFLDFKNNYAKIGWTKKIVYIKARTRNKLVQDGIGDELDKLKDILFI